MLSCKVLACSDLEPHASALGAPRGYCKRADIVFSRCNLPWPSTSFIAERVSHRYLQNTIGMAVVGSIFLALKRFNLAAIYDSRKRELHSKSET